MTRDYLTNLRDTHPVTVAVVRRRQYLTDPDFDNLKAIISRARKLTAIRWASSGNADYFLGTEETAERDGKRLLDFLHSELADLPVTIDSTPAELTAPVPLAGDPRDACDNWPHQGGDDRVACTHPTCADIQMSVAEEKERVERLKSHLTDVTDKHNEVMRKRFHIPVSPVKEKPN